MNKLFMLISSALFLAGCVNNPTDSSESVVPSSSEQESSSASSSSDSSDDATSDDDSNDSGTSDATSGTSEGTTRTYPEIKKDPSNLKGEEWFKYYGEREGCRAFPSIGEQNVLVVPLLFKDESKPMSSFSRSVLNDLKNVYVGGEGTTSFCSVQEYYERASYGQLHLNINVLDKWCVLDKTLDELYAVDTSVYVDQSWYGVDYVTSWYKKNYDDIAKYDNDKDGFIDSLIIILGHGAYTNKTWPYLDGAPTEAEKKLCWAYTFWEYKNEPGTLESPNANAYNWVSYEYIKDNDVKKPNPHTYIHEFGHILGLDDYYDYDYQEDGSRFSPAGQVNMQDYNVGDQDSYSKYLLDWTQPQIVKSAKEITIEPFESSGDCILIPASETFDNSPMEEYLMIDLYSPTGLNEADAGISGHHVFSNPGIKVYHVDSRVGKISYDEETSTSTFISYADNPTYASLTEDGQKPYYYDIIASNTESYCTNNTEFKELNLLSSAHSSVSQAVYMSLKVTSTDSETGETTEIDIPSYDSWSVTDETYKTTKDKVTDQVITYYGGDGHSSPEVSEDTMTSSTESQAYYNEDGNIVIFDKDMTTGESYLNTVWGQSYCDYWNMTYGRWKAAYKDMYTMAKYDANYFSTGFGRNTDVVTRLSYYAGYYDDVDSTDTTDYTQYIVKTVSSWEDYSIVSVTTIDPKYNTVFGMCTSTGSNGYDAATDADVTAIFNVTAKFDTNTGVLLSETFSTTYTCDKNPNTGANLDAAYVIYAKSTTYDTFAATEETYTGEKLEMTEADESLYAFYGLWYESADTFWFITIANGGIPCTYYVDWTGVTTVSKALRDGFTSANPPYMDGNSVRFTGARAFVVDTVTTTDESGAETTTNVSSKLDYVMTINAYGNLNVMTSRNDTGAALYAKTYLSAANYAASQTSAE